MDFQEFSPIEFNNEPLTNFFYENMDTEDDLSDASDEESDAN